MTSKISSIKLLKEAVKRDGAFAILLLLGFFCYYPIGGMLLLRDVWHGNIGDSVQWTDVLQLFGISNPFLFALTFGIAFLLGIMQFAYLHSREKLDFYHSIPVRREKLFVIRYGAGILVWLVPFILNLLLFIIICAVNGIAVLEGTAAGPLLWMLIKGLAAHIACFLLVYSLTVLAMMVTGKIFAAAVGFAVFCAYVPAIKLLQEIMMEFYFTTFYSIPDLGKSIAVQCTPVYAYIRICSDLMKKTVPADLLIAVILISALISGLCLYFYRKRSSEMAGKAMVFGKLARVVKFLLVVPVTLICAVFFYAITENNILWEIFGWIFGLLIISGLIEFIYCMDIREVFCDRKQIGLTAVVTLAVLAVFQFDLLGYDRWLPKKTEVESVTLRNSLPLTSRGVGVYEQLITPDGTTVYNLTDYQDADEPTTTLAADTADMDAVYNLVEHSESLKGQPVRETEDYWSYYWCRMTVTWHMKDGTQKVRSYEYTEEELEKWLAPLWESGEYKKAMCPVLKIAPENVIAVQVSQTGYYYPEVVTVENGDKAPGEKNKTAQTEDNEEAAQPEDDAEGDAEMAQTEFDMEAEDALEYAEETMKDARLLNPEKPLTKAQMQKLTETFQEELGTETLAQAFTTNELDIHILYRGEDGRVYGETYNLNDGFAGTLELLKDYGYAVE